MQEKDAGLYWTPHGGNGTKLMWASCHEYTSVVENGDGSKSTDRILVDLGQFESPDKISDNKYSKIIPDVSALIDVPGHESDDVKAQALLLTHGHSDHFDSVFEYARMGAKLPPIYGSEYTLRLLKEGFVSRGMKWEDHVDLHTIKENDVLQLGSMTVEVVTAPHSIPGSLGFKISNPSASIFHSGDIKLEEKSFIRQGADLSQLARLGDDGIDLAVMDACGAAKTGHAYGLQDEFDVCCEQFGKHEGKQVVVVLPPAHVELIACVMAAAKESGREVVVEGGPIMESHLLGLEVGELQDKFPNFVESADKLKDKNNSVVITCGIHAGETDGDEYSPFLHGLRRGEKFAPMQDDAVVLIAEKKDVLVPFIEKVYPEAKIYTAADKGLERLHAPGHACSEDLQDLFKLLKPKCVAPVHTSEENRGTFNKDAVKNGWTIVEGNRSVQNGDTVKVVSGQPARIVDSRTERAFCFDHEIVQTVLDNGLFRMDVKQSDVYYGVSYAALGITGDKTTEKPQEFSYQPSKRERRKLCEKNKEQYLQDKQAEAKKKREVSKPQAAALALKGKKGDGR